MYGPDAPPRLRSGLEFTPGADSSVIAVEDGTGWRVELSMLDSMLARQMDGSTSIAQLAKRSSVTRAEIERVVRHLSSLGVLEGRAEGARSIRPPGVELGSTRVGNASEPAAISIFTVPPPAAVPIVARMSERPRPKTAPPPPPPSPSPSPSSTAAEVVRPESGALHDQAPAATGVTQRNPVSAVGGRSRSWRVLSVAATLAVAAVLAWPWPETLKAKVTVAPSGTAVVAPVSAVVAEVLATDGVPVQAGQTILRLDDPGLRRKRDEIAARLAELKRARQGTPEAEEAVFDRVAGEVRAAEHEVREAEAKGGRPLFVARAKLRAKRAELLRAHDTAKAVHPETSPLRSTVQLAVVEGELRTFDAQLDRLVVRAPSAGPLRLAPAARVGAPVEAGTVLAQLDVVSPTDLDVFVPDPQGERVAIGQEVIVQFPSGSLGGRVVAAERGQSAGTRVTLRSNEPLALADARGPAPAVIRVGRSSILARLYEALL